MTNDIREQITEWLTGEDTCFLLGAGCGVCAGKKIMDELTKSVLNSMGSNKKLVALFKRLKPASNRSSATIEDLISYLIGSRELHGRITKVDNHDDISIDDIDAWLADIKCQIVTEIADDWESSRYHERFLRRLRRQTRRGPRDIFSLNYDTLLEASLDKLRISYADGFRGTNRAWFDPDSFDDKSVCYRLFKLHGSINWTQDNEGHVRRGCNADKNATGKSVIVYPSEQKYLQTQYGVYETLIAYFRNRLRSKRVNNYLVVLGYSFKDDHINKAITDAIASHGSNLTVIAFVGPDKKQMSQVTCMETLASQCDSRFNAFIGNDTEGRFVGCALDQASAKAVLNAELWKFENLVNFTAREAL